MVSLSACLSVDPLVVVAGPSASVVAASVVAASVASASVASASVVAAAVAAGQSRHHQMVVVAAGWAMVSVCALLGGVWMCASVLVC